MSTTDQDREPDAPQESRVRTTEYFVPKDGIDLEVITADICLYLGKDARVQGGPYIVSYDLRRPREK
jgi:hypothetical protein